MKRLEPIVAGLLFLATIPLANWMIGNVGTCVPQGPCLIPVWPGVLAPSGVLVAGLAFVLRDWVHEQLGVAVCVGLIVAGAGLSVLVASPAVAIASGAAFLISELADLLVYAPLRERHLLSAVALSSIVGSVVDSAAFLLIAFGSLQYIVGQVLGKAWMVAAAMLVIVAIRVVKERQPA